MSTPQQPSPNSMAIIVDSGFVVLFCVLGGLSHSLGHPDAVARIAFSTWPFLVGLIVVHAAVLLGRLDARRIVPGILIWLVTVAGGMTLRALTGAGTAVPFLIVTAVVLALFLVGWRACYALVTRRRQAR